MGEEIFVPNCRASDAKEDGTFPCNPKIIDKDGKVWASKRPVQVRIYQGKPVILDDGQAPTKVIKKLMRWLDENKYK